LDDGLVKQSGALDDRPEQVQVGRWNFHIQDGMTATDA
jgi:hypothetical protein